MQGVADPPRLLLIPCRFHLLPIHPNGLGGRVGYLNRFLPGQPSYANVAS